MNSIEITEFGDSALLVRATEGTREQKWRTVQRLADTVDAAGLAGVYDLVATYDSLLVEFDCLCLSHAEAARVVRKAADGMEITQSAARARTFRIPVVYGDEYGPDLSDVVGQLGLTPAEVIRQHTHADWVVRFLGAPAGAPMLDGSPFPAPVSRCPRPRVRVPAGSVAVAGGQSVIYPVDSPGGWRLIGRTPLRLLDAAHWPHVAYRPGDHFQFVPVPAASWTDHVGQLE